MFLLYCHLLCLCTNFHVGSWCISFKAADRHLDLLKTTLVIYKPSYSTLFLNANCGGTYSKMSFTNPNLVLLLQQNITAGSLEAAAAFVNLDA